MKIRVHNVNGQYTVPPLHSPMLRYIGLPYLTKGSKFSKNQKLKKTLIADRIHDGYYSVHKKLPPKLQYNKVCRVQSTQNYRRTPP